MHQIEYWSHSHVGNILIKLQVELSQLSNDQNLLPRNICKCRSSVTQTQTSVLKGVLDSLLNNTTVNNLVVGKGKHQCNLLPYGVEVDQDAVRASFGITSTDCPPSIH